MKLNSNNLKLFLGKIKLKNIKFSSLEISKLTSITIKFGNKLKLIELISKINSTLSFYKSDYLYNIIIYLDNKDINNFIINVKSPSIYFYLENFFNLKNLEYRFLNLVIIFYFSKLKLFDMKFKNFFLKSFCKSIQCSLFSKKIFLVY